MTCEMRVMAQAPVSRLEDQAPSVMYKWPCICHECRACDLSAKAKAIWDTLQSPHPSSSVTLTTWVISVRPAPVSE